MSMDKGVILYRSKYGAAKKYANWLKELTRYDCIEASKGNIDSVMRYDVIILCGGIYASGIAGISFLKRNIKKLKDKKIAVFCTGASPYDKQTFHELRERNMTGALQGVPLFYGRGMWDESRMTFIDRNLCRLLQKSVEKKDPNTYEPWMKALMAAAGQSCDWTDKKYLAPLMECLGLDFAFLEETKNDR